MNELALTNSTENILVSMVSDGKAQNTIAAYRGAIKGFLSWTHVHRLGFSRRSVLAYVQYLRDSDYAVATINQRLSAIRQLAKEIHFDPAAGNEERATADGIMAVDNLPKRGRRLGHWLNTEQSNALLAIPDLSTLKGKRDYLILALLLGCGLRRAEAAVLDFEQIQERLGNWLIVNLEGKGNKTRSIHLSPWVVGALADWKNASGLEIAWILRAVNKADRLTGPMPTRYGRVSSGGMSAQGVYNVVKALAKAIDMPDLGPHSLRRTWARRAYKMGYPLDQISLMLGHSSLTTTEIYLGLKDLDLDNPVHVTF